MESLTYHDKHFVPLDSSKQVATKNSLTHEHSGVNLNQHNNQPVAKATALQSQSNNCITPPVNSNKVVQSCPVFSSPTSQVTVSQGTYSRTIQPQSSHSKYSDNPSLNLHWKTSLSPSRKSLNLPFSYFKSPATSSNFNKTPLSLEPNQRVLSSRLLLLKPENLHSIPDIWVSPSLKSSKKVSSSSLSPLQHEETTSVNVIWTSSALRSNQKACSSTALQTKYPKTTSLDCLWKSLLEQNQRSLQSPFLKKKLQANKCIQTSPSLEFNHTPMSSPSPEHSLQKLPTLSSNTHVMSLPLSNLTLKKSSLSHSIQQSPSFPLFQSKSQTIRLDGNFQTLNSNYHSKLNTTSPNDKYRPTYPWSSRPKLNTSGQSLSSIKHCIKSTASTLGSRLQSKSSFDFRSKTKLNKEYPWTFSYMYPFVVKGGTLPDDVVNKIVNSVSKARIQRDICRQILFRRMRGRPNPHPGPRLSSAYTVCLACASCIKSQCNHRIGRKDPRCATLFVIPTPETTSEGKIVVKLLLILSLPEISSSLLFPMKENQLDEALDNGLERMEKIPQVVPTSDSGICQQKLSPEKKVSEHQTQAIEWLLYVKSTNALHPPSQLPSLSSSFSSTGSSASSSSSSSCPALPPPPLPTKEDCPQTPPSDRVFKKVLSYQQRLPQGVSWLDFICNKEYQPLEGKQKQGQAPSPQPKPVRSYITIKGIKGPSLLFKFFQSFKVRNSD
ncbi:casein kinase II subunit alpha'-interacting protein [Perognathus longimembris pacificus]|uniref:casein kinase II subunit alpha'-interacting protein n=1 Tax=Perognathus longimembris pacificus TaxID=214514 RepID=UPI00201A0237|nr:casein kinase II subunit alpha'-interacting protein [Perognathus longimembris pacificus]